MLSRDNLSDAFGIVSNAAIVNGYNLDLSNSMSFKILLLSTAFTGLLTFKFYEVVLLSKVIAKAEGDAVETLEAVLETDLSVGFVSGNSLQSFFEHSPNGTTAKEIWDERIKPRYTTGVAQK